MDERLQFSGREEFRGWLQDHCRTDGGVWLLFGKAGGPRTITAAEALEEALCFGWIDGQMQRIDDRSYVKYFPRAGRTASGRRRTKRWLKSWSGRDA